MTSVYSVMFTLVLFSELSSHSLAAAVPTDPDGLGPLLGDEAMGEPGAGLTLYKGSRVVDGVGDEDRSPRIIILSDARRRGHSVRPAFPRDLPLLADRGLSHTPDEHSLKVDRRDTDIDILRCMIGRVYRPCWEM